MAGTTTPMIIVQVLIGLLVVYAVYVLSLRLIATDRLAIDKHAVVRSGHFETKILDGYADSTVLATKTYNTVNSHAQNYLSLPDSFNRTGGAQYSYSFWIFVDDPEQAKHKTIFHRGDVRAYNAALFVGGDKVANFVPPRVSTNAGGDRTGVEFATPPDHVLTYPFISSPCVTFADRYDEIGIFFNTIQWPFASVTINPANDADDNTKRRDAMKLIAHKWALFTIVIEDSVAVNDFEDGIVVRFYLNDMLYYTEHVQGALRTNTGHFHIFPDGGIQGTRIGNLTYFNYAIGQERVKSIYDKGPPKHYSRDIMSGSALGDPLFLSEYNKLDIYNN